MRFDRPSEAAALLRVSEAWAEYLPAYENLISRHGGAMGGAADLDRVVDLREHLDRLVGGYASVDEPASRGEHEEVAHDPDAPSSLAEPDLTWPAARTPDMIASVRGRNPHNIAWLPAVPLTNADPLDLYVWTTIPPEHVPSHGLPVADVFLLAHLDGERLAARQRSGFVLRLSIPHGTAVDPSAYTTRLPARLQHRVREAPDIYLVPLAWLSAVTITGWYQLDGDGGCASAWSIDGAALTVCFKGADHGVPGLPSEVVRWPARRDTVDAYLTLPDDPDWIQARLSTYPGWLPLYRRRPNVAPGYRLLEVAVARRCAIDLPESMAGLAGDPGCGSHAQLILRSGRCFARASSSRILRSRGCTPPDPADEPCRATLCWAGRSPPHCPTSAARLARDRERRHRATTRISWACGRSIASAGPSVTLWTGTSQRASSAGGSSSTSATPRTTWPASTRMTSTTFYPSQGPAATDPDPE